MDEPEIIKCLKCGHVLIAGSGVKCLFGPGTSIECRKCGNKYTFEKKLCLKQENGKITFEV